MTTEIQTPSTTIDVASINRDVLNAFARFWTDLPFHNLQNTDQQFVTGKIAEYVERQRAEHPSFQAKDITLKMIGR